MTGGIEVMVKVKGAQGKRYSPSQKAEIIKFIKEFNAKNKRGGLKAAGDKYGVTVVTLSAWMKKAGKPAAKAAAKQVRNQRRKLVVNVKNAQPPQRLLPQQQHR